MLEEERFFLFLLKVNKLNLHHMLSSINTSSPYGDLNNMKVIR